MFIFRVGLLSVFGCVWFACACGAVSVAGAGVFVRSRLLGCGGVTSVMYWVDWALTMSADVALGFALGFAFALGPSS